LTPRDAKKLFVPFDPTNRHEAKSPLASLPCQTPFHAGLFKHRPQDSSLTITLSLMILWPICHWNCFQEFQSLKRRGYDATVAADLGMDGASTHARRAT
jgi:hypothetical protein